MRLTIDNISTIVSKIQQIDESLLSSERVITEIVLSRIPQNIVLELERLKQSRSTHSSPDDGELEEVESLKI